MNKEKHTNNTKDNLLSYQKAALSVLIEQIGKQYFSKYNKFDIKKHEEVFAKVYLSIQRELDNLLDGEMTLLEKTRIEKLNQIKTMLLSNNTSVYTKQEQLENDLKTRLLAAISSENNPEEIDKVKKSIQLSSINVNDLIIKMLSSVHHEWITNAESSNQFFEEEKANIRFKFLPAEFIGFEELQKYLTILDSILKKLDIEYNPTNLEKAYHQFAQDRLQIDLESPTITKECLINYIQFQMPNETYNEKRNEWLPVPGSAERILEQRKTEVAEGMAKQVIDRNPIINNLINYREFVPKVTVSEEDVLKNMKASTSAQNKIQTTKSPERN